MFIFLHVTCHITRHNHNLVGEKSSWIFLSYWIIFAENVDTTKKNGQVIRSILHYFSVILDQYVASYSLYTMFVLKW